jgi:hypothetical protein
MQSRIRTVVIDRMHCSRTLKLIDWTNCLLRCFLNVDPVQVKGIGVPILLYPLDLSWIFCEFNFDEYVILGIQINSAQNVNAV